MIGFRFDRRVLPEGSDTPVTEAVVMSVPLLAILPVPWIRVEEGSIDFEAKVSSSTLNQTDSSFGLSAAASGGFWGVKFSVKATYSRQSKFRDQVNRSSTLTVHVKVTQDEMPAGLARLIDILETAINDSDLTQTP